MGTSVKELTSPVVKTMDVVEETLYDQGDLKDDGDSPSLDIELLPTQGCESISSNNGNADERGAACESENKEYRSGDPKETDEETRKAAYSPTKACAADVPYMRSSNSNTVIQLISLNSNPFRIIGSEEGSATDEFYPMMDTGILEIGGPSKGAVVGG
ncbi:hypothetical protein Bpfe_021413 [Biomphalaria pfeifferi]|uniref:Uncharacterized protein n=1 Tax=Biomphalaria pfeifferi TaxID=112525 RepID=A0AAD8B845_BIOPF|nr:hypothetical protein Bpfe_021413 [Biomphalaria pfeifferi]